jgi:hypothetical protein
MQRDHVVETDAMGDIDPTHQQDLPWDDAHSGVNIFPSPKSSHKVV